MSDVHCKCGAGPSLLLPQRCTHGHPLPGFKGPAYKHGLRSFEARGPEALPPSLKSSVDEFRESLVADRGGLENTTTVERGYIARLTEVETAARLTAADLAARGLVHGTFTRWWPCELWDRYARRLGMERKARQVDPLDAYLQGRTG